MLPIVLRTRNRMLDFDTPLSPFAEFEHMLEHAWDGSRPDGVFGGCDYVLEVGFRLLSED